MCVHINARVPEEAPCCARAIKYGEARLCKTLLPLLKDLVRAPPLPAQRVEAVKALCAAHPGLVDLVDTLVEAEATAST